MFAAAEFDEVVKPYLTRNPNKPGEPVGFVFWQKFATDLQTLADRKTHSDAFMSRLSKIEAKERVAARIERECVARIRILGHSRAGVSGSSNSSSCSSPRWQLHPPGRCGSSSSSCSSVTAAASARPLCRQNCAHETWRPWALLRG